MNSKTLNIVGIAAISVGALLVCVAIYAFVMTILQSNNRNVQNIAKKEGLIPPNPAAYDPVLLSTDQLVRRSN